MTTYDSHYINGAWHKAHNPAVLEVHDSTTEEVMATVPQGTAEEATKAVLAARAAFPAWSALSVEERCVYIDKIVAGLKARTDEMGTAIAREVGMPIKMAKMIQVGGPVFNWGNAAKAARAFHWEEKVGNSRVVREPIGVVGCITPWNFPLNQISLKVAPALAAGCTVVLKPSEIAPVNAMILTEIIHAAELPAGVFNLVNGLGPVVGEVLASHPEVDMVSFTGSTRAGKRVAELAAATVKRVTLELGGKSASVILPDADLAAAVKGTIGACLLNSGQTCSAHTRMLVPAKRYDEVKALVQATIAKFTLGPSLDENTRLGPLVSAAQRERVLGFIRQGLEEGAELVAGGADKPAFDTGYFVQPTVLRVKPNDTLAREEIFGPVATVQRVADYEEALALSNDTEFGLSAGICTSSLKYATHFKRNAEAGMVMVNLPTAGVDYHVPFGGRKGSSYGPREQGAYAKEFFTTVKTSYSFAG
jgi:betaine-aldehyde dehydrogenase